MKEQNLNDKIFSVTDCPDASNLFNYSKGELQDIEALQLERHIAECSLCEDALEGMLLVSGTDVLQEIHEQNKYGNDFDFKKHKFRELKIVLSATILVIAAFIFLYINKPNNDKQIVEKGSKVLVTDTIYEKHNFPTVIQKPNDKGAEEIIIPKKKGAISTTIVTDTISTATNYSIKRDSNLVMTTDVTPKIIEEKKHGMRISSGLQVIYIHELKVVDYTSLYDEISFRKAGLFTGVSPHFENAKSNLLLITAEEPVSQILSQTI